MLATRHHCLISRCGSPRAVHPSEIRKSQRINQAAPVPGGHPWARRRPRVGRKAATTPRALAARGAAEAASIQQQLPMHEQPSFSPRCTAMAGTRSRTHACTRPGTNGRWAWPLWPVFGCTAQKINRGVYNNNRWSRTVLFSPS